MTASENFNFCRLDFCSSVSNGGKESLCPAHYLQNLKGEEFYVVGSRRTKREEDCSYGDCTRVRHCKGLCYSHYQQDRIKGVLTDLPPVPDVLCSENGCSRRVKSKGLCASHYNTYRIAKAPVCSFNVCERKVESKGLCHGHGEQQRAGKELTDIRRWGVYNLGVECPVNGCAKAATGPLGCVKHRSIAATYNLTVEQMSRLSTSCDVCGETKRLCVDHDHSCCPGKDSCGKCVRGVLCTWCNSTLGHAKDDISRLKGLVAYLEAGVRIKDSSA